MKRNSKYIRQCSSVWHLPTIPIRIAQTGAARVSGMAVALCRNIRIPASGYIVGPTIIADGGTIALTLLISDFRRKSASTFGKD
jgi:hypothetical protein